MTNAAQWTHCKAMMFNRLGVLNAFSIYNMFMGCNPIISWETAICIMSLVINIWMCMCTCILISHVRNFRYTWMKIGTLGLKQEHLICILKCQEFFSLWNRRKVYIGEVTQTMCTHMSKCKKKKEKKSIYCILDLLSKKAK
jgi:hypothetical protein